MQVLIVDDEPIAQEILQIYASKVPGLEVAGTCGNALEAFGILNTKQVDLLLLDINMPEISGVDFLKSLRQPPMTIFTTAYPEYALTGYELDVLDYLVKPVPFDRFLKAIQKAQRLLQQPPEARSDKDSRPDILFVKSEGKLVKINLRELWLVEGLKDYVRLWIGGTRIVVYSTMKNIAELLSDRGHFIRVSKSYVVNMNYVDELDGAAIRIGGQSIAIGATYKDETLAVFNRFKLL